MSDEERVSVESEETHIHMEDSDRGDQPVESPQPKSEPVEQGDDESSE